MKEDELKKREEKLMELLVKRRALGGFDVNAAAILEILETEYEVVRHLREQLSRKK
jgi:hypothetical protein